MDMDVDVPPSSLIQCGYASSYSMVGTTFALPGCYCSSWWVSLSFSLSLAGRLVTLLHQTRFGSQSISTTPFCPLKGTAHLIFQFQFLPSIAETKKLQRPLLGSFCERRYVLFRSFSVAWNVVSAENLRKGWLVLDKQFDFLISGCLMIWLVLFRMRICHDCDIQFYWGIQGDILSGSSLWWSKEAGVQRGLIWDIFSLVKFNFDSLLHIVSCPSLPPPLSFTSLLFPHGLFAAVLSNFWTKLKISVPIFYRLFFLLFRNFIQRFSPLKSFNNETQPCIASCYHLWNLLHILFQ